jgi:biopolymer transport protein ExbD
MTRKKKKIPEVNATSTADIAFIMLIFFLITSTMDVDSGIIRRLPPPIDPNEQQQEDINKRNLFEVRINSQDYLWVKGQYMNVGDLKDATKIFIANKSNNPNMSDKKEVHIPLLGGTYMASRGIISLKNDRGTSYDMYVQVQNELARAITELRNELSKEQFGVNFMDLIDQEKIEAIQKAIPVAISEAEPENVERK